MEQEKKHTWHPKLNAHRAIGIDIDSTLIDGPCSRRLQEWVWDHYQELDLHLVTFRYGADFQYVAQDIGEHGLKLDMFKGLHGIDQDFAELFWQLRLKVGDRVPESEEKRLQHLRRKWLRGLTHHKTTEEEYERLFSTVAHWKGAKCKELGLTALIDDLGEYVRPGCDVHGVEWIDALNL